MLVSRVNDNCKLPSLVNHIFFSTKWNFFDTFFLSQELRETYDKQTKENQEEFSKVYDDKIRNLQDALDKEKVTKAGREQEVREMITKVSALTSRNVELEGSNASLQKRMAELQKEMDDLSARMRAEMAAKDAEVKNKDDQMDAMTKDYKVWMYVSM